jgi:hypothetical protein
VSGKEERGSGESKERRVERIIDVVGRGGAREG